MIFSIAMGADYAPYMKSIATFAPTFYGYIISILASVSNKLQIFHENKHQPQKQSHRIEIQVLKYTNIL